MKKPKVSIIIPFYNCQYVGQAIESALAQSYTNKEVIVVNDGSTKYTDSVKPFLHRIKYIEKQNGGTASALNAGINAANGEYFSWLSSDDLFVKNKTELQMEFMQTQRAAVSHTNYHVINEKSQIIRSYVGKVITNKKELYSYLMTKCHINGCTVIMNMNVFHKIGLFNEKLHFTQDYDMWLRVLQHEEFHFLNQPLLFSRYHPEMGTLNYLDEAKKERQKVSNKYHAFLSNRLNSHL